MNRFACGHENSSIWCVAFLVLFLKEEDIIQKERSNVTCALGAYGTIHNVIIENNITSRFHLVLLLPKPHVVTP